MSTSAQLPDTFRIEETATGLSVRLPWRRPARVLVAKVVLKLVLFGLVVLGGAAVAALNLRGPHSASLAVAVGTLGVALVAGGLCLLATRASAKVVGRQLVLTEWIGPVPVQRSRSFDRLRRIATHYALEGDGADPPPNGVLEITSAGAQALWFAAGYPRDWLVALGTHLAECCGVPHVEMPLDTPTEKVTPFFLGALRDRDTFDQSVQPAASPIQAEHEPDGLTVLRVPPGLVGAGWSGVVLFLHLLAVFPGVGLCATVLPWPYLLAVPAVAATLSALLWAYHFANRMTVLAVAPEGLNILTTGGILPSRQRHVPRVSIRELRVGPGSVGQRGVPTSQLYVYLTNGRELHLLCGRNEDELSWLATELRQALGVPAVAAKVLTAEELASGRW